MIFGSSIFGQHMRRGMTTVPAAPAPAPVPVHPFRPFMRLRRAAATTAVTQGQSSFGPSLTPQQIAEMQRYPEARSGAGHFGPMPVAVTLTPQQIAEMRRYPEARHGAGHFVNLAPPPPPPALAPPPPPPPPPSALPAWQQSWLNLLARQREQQANQGAGHFNGFGRPMPHPHVARARVMRYSHPRVRHYMPEMYTSPTIVEYLQPLPGCTVSPNPIPPCSGTLTWVDSRTVCCR